MIQTDLIEKFAELPAFLSLLEKLEKREPVVFLPNIPIQVTPFLAVLLQKKLSGSTIVLVADGLKTQDRLHRDVETWLCYFSPLNHSEPETEQSLFFPSWGVLPQDYKLPHVDVLADRLNSLSKLLHQKNQNCNSNNHSDRIHENRIVVSSIQALLERTFSPEELSLRTKLITTNDTADPLQLIEWLDKQAYDPVAKVTQKGEFALRGGILDVYPLTSPWPIRIEFFGNQVESIREFDPYDQRSRGDKNEVLLTPAGEPGLLRRKIIIPSGEQKHTKQAKDVNDECLNLPPGHLSDYFCPQAVLIFSSYEEIEEAALNFSEKLNNLPDPLYLTHDQFFEMLNQKGIQIIQCSELDNSTHTNINKCDFQVENIEHYFPTNISVTEKNLPEIRQQEALEQIHRWLRQGNKVTVFCNNEGEKSRFLEIWSELQTGKTLIQSPETRSPLETHEYLDIFVGSLSGGFAWSPANFVVITDGEIFGRYKIIQPRRLKSQHAVAARSAMESDFSHLEEGDYVVHIQHGIGKYVGLQNVPVSQLGQHWDKTESAPLQECLVIEYAPTEPGQPAPRLYVPITEAHLVTKYIGAGKSRPQLSKLGTSSWLKTKTHVARAIQDFAAKLLSIQALRESQPGFAFPPDTVWQKEFENAFIFEETPDQLKAISEVKTDMESSKPMDRLICGDVGFGKTEVAIRAAFKAIMAGKQVAMLTPTTVLAQQHYNSFTERMADYPIRIELLSRFRSKAEQEKIIDQLRVGSIDIVIGTHRLVQKDIVFKDLGLLIIDEEQRFGVEHKEKLKHLRANIDILTLTATPIPRTLYMALMGVRSMSSIISPPRDRLPVETIVVPYDEDIIREAILRELNRQGQVYYLHNRVDTITQTAQKISKLVPTAKVAIAHGQMKPSELEEIMTEFVNGKIDVLVCTTIIENGLDIPNANTIIIERPDRFGLCDLYQLRGRVGRYKNQAYAYFLLPRHANLLADARKRLSAIKQYAKPGSGLKIALRDLEIRGAGNILGKEQSGHISAIGFDLYCKLLNQSIRKLKGQHIQDTNNVNIKLDFLLLAPTKPKNTLRPTIMEYDPFATTQNSKNIAVAGIPESYISDPSQRIEIYQRLSNVTSLAELNNLKDEIKDRFGPIVEPVSFLLKLAEIKIHAANKGISEISSTDSKIIIKGLKGPITVNGKLPRFTRKTASARLNEISKIISAM